MHYRKSTSELNPYILCSDSKRNINYCSFQPILRLLEVGHTPECQHWAAWALANLTSVYPDKYCELVEAEGGLALLQAVLDDADSPYPFIKPLARMVLDNCRRTQHADELMDSSP